MKCGVWIIGLGAVLPFLGGCAGMSHTAEGAGIGALLGTGTGAIIDRATGGKGGTGALLGLATGTVIGGAIGNEADKKEKDALIQAKADAEANASQGTPMGLTDVVQLAQRNTSDEVIINQIRSTNSTFQLSTEDLRFLKENGVSDRVVLEMQNRRPTQVLTPRYVPVHRHPRYMYAPPPAVIFVEPPPPPPPGFGVGFVIR